MRTRSLRRAFVRSLPPSALLIIVDREFVWIGVQKILGMSSTISLDMRSREISAQELINTARWDFGFDDPYIIQFLLDLIDIDSSQRANFVKAVALQHVAAEINRFHVLMNIIQINPLFGPASYAIDNRLAFVLMPFREDLTRIYHNLIKATVQRDTFDSVCKRADDIKSNRAAIQDIWKSICEARLIIADDWTERECNVRTRNSA